MMPSLPIVKIMRVPTMNKHIFIISFIYGLCLAQMAKADIEAINGLMDNMTGVETIKSAVQQAQSLQDTVESVKMQAGDMVNSVTSTIDSAKNAVTSAVGSVTDLASGAQNLEFSGLNGMFDGSKSPNEQENAALDLAVRKKGEGNAIQAEKERNKALNMLAGKELEGIYAHALAMRVKIQGETDDIQNPESMPVAVSLAQDEAIKAIKRRNQIVLLEAMNLAFRAARALGNLGDEGDDEE